MGDLSKNFNRHEFACKGIGCCGGIAAVHPDLATGIQELRDKINMYRRITSNISYMPNYSLTISSGVRCITHNEKKIEDGGAGGKKGSIHCLGMAADILCPAWIKADEFSGIAESIPIFFKGGIGIYSDPERIHVDIVHFEKPRRWRMGKYKNG